LHHRFGLPLLRAADFTTVVEVQPCSRLVLAARARPYGQVKVEVTLDTVARGTLITIRELPRAGPVVRLPRVARAIQRWRNQRSADSLARLAMRAAQRDSDRQGDGAR